MEKSKAKNDKWMYKKEKNTSASRRKRRKQSENDKKGWSDKRKGQNR